VNRSLQASLRRLTQATRPLALRSAGTVKSNNSIVHHIGRKSGRNYQTPVVAAEHGDDILIALPYGHRTDWMKNVVASGKASVVTRGQSVEVDQPRVVPMDEATMYFQPKEQKLHKRFAIESCLRVHRLTS
jgi:deazaflavin-dependent oxidoreductase (nitroreductase family)